MRSSCGGTDAESAPSLGLFGFCEEVHSLKPMERQVDGDEPAGSLGSAEEPGKNALFPLLRDLYIPQETLIGNIINARALSALERTYLRPCLHSSPC